MRSIHLNIIKDTDISRDVGGSTRGVYELGVCDTKHE